MLPLIDISEYKCYNILAKIIGLLFERDQSRLSAQQLYGGNFFVMDKSEELYS